MKDLSATEIRTLGPDEKITEPGFYAIPIDRHHDQPCDGPSVTSGVLRKMELQTPADVWAFSKLNPNRWPEKDSDALRTGRAMAAYIEGGPEELERHFWVLPKNKPNRPTAAQLKAYEDGKASEAGARSVEFWRAVEDDPRDVITEAQWETICDMGKVLAADPAASAALGGMPEITMAWFDEKTDLWVLSRPDQVSFSGMLSDYKKINTQGRPFDHRVVDRRITDHGYNMQMALAAEAFQHLTGQWPDQVGIVAQWDAPPHHVILREILEEHLRMGVFQNQRARMRFRECLDLGHWPGPGEDVAAYQMPEWMSERLTEDMSAAGVEF